jgi:carboxyl-terminal processing protease
MNRHKSFIKGALTGALIMLFAVGVCTKVPELSGLLLQKDSVTAKQERAEKKTEAKFKKIEKMIDQYYLYSDDVKQDDLEDAVYAGFLSALNDPYTVYYNEEETKEIKESTSGEYSGIGAAMMQNVQTGEITITTVYEDSPAEKAGLLEGDILYQVDDHKIEDQDTSEVVSWIKGEEGTEVKLSVYRGEDREEHTLTAVREKIQSQTVEHEMKEDKIGYISVQGFEDVTYEQFKSALEDLEAQGMEGLVIDLRNNPGGNLDTVVEMLKLILPEGRIVSIKDKYGNEETYDCDGKHEFQKPLAVLVNGYSASASEIFAGAVKDYGIGTLVGTTTYGKGIVQELFSFEDDTMIKITTAEYFTPSGENIHKKGIKPDIEVKDNMKTKADEQLNKAISILQKK